MERRIFGMEYEYGLMVYLKGEGWRGITMTELFSPGGLIWPAYRSEIPKEILSGVLGKYRQFLSKYPTETHAERLTTIFLDNGGSYGIDVGHPEYRTPECVTARSMVAADRAGELWMERFFNEISSDDLRLILLKDNVSSDDLISFGHHESYLCDRAKIGNFQDEYFVQSIIPFLITRQCICGAGNVSTRELTTGRYFLSKRSPFIKMERNPGHPTVQNRAIVNLKNEPLADTSRYLRFHLCIGDPNFADYTNYLKVGITSLVLRMIEDHLIDPEKIGVIHPVDALWDVCRDLTCKKPLIWIAGDKRDRRFDALNIQEYYWDKAWRNYPASNDSEETVRETLDIIDKWNYVLLWLGKDPKKLVGKLDWPTKKELCERKLKKEGISWEELIQRLQRGESNSKIQKVLFQIKAIDQKYHELSPQGLGKILRDRGKLELLVSREEIEEMVNFPPGMRHKLERTRAWPRGHFIRWLKTQPIEIQKIGMGVSWQEIRCPGVMNLDFSDPFKWKYQALKNIVPS